MKCPNCKKKIDRVSKDAYDCAECDEIFLMSDGKLTLVKNKEEVIKGIREKLGVASKTIKELAERHDISIEDKDEFFFG